MVSSFTRSPPNPTRLPRRSTRRAHRNAPIGWYFESASVSPQTALRASTHRNTNTEATMAASRSFHFHRIPHATTTSSSSLSSLAKQQKPIPTVTPAPKPLASTFSKRDASSTSSLDELMLTPPSPPPPPFVAPSLCHYFTCCLYPFLSFNLPKAKIDTNIARDESNTSQQAKDVKGTKNDAAIIGGCKGVVETSSIAYCCRQNHVQQQLQLSESSARATLRHMDLSDIAEETDSRIQDEEEEEVNENDDGGCFHDYDVHVIDHALTIEA